MQSAEPPLVLTLGDPAGIGPDIALLAYQGRAAEPIPPFVLLGDAEVLAARARQLGLTTKIERVSEPGAASTLFAKALPVLPIGVPGTVVAGRPDPAAASAIQQSIEHAVALVLDGAASAVVTNPISKAALTRTGFAFHGHTEFLAELSGRKPSDAVMMLVAHDFKVVPVTIHIPLKEVTTALTKALILKTLATTARDLARYFGLSSPHIAVTGLNPHAGENGTLGREEIDIIAPAIETARSQGLNVTGPHSADSLFRAEARRPTMWPSPCIMTRP
ncbi:MAG: 4-hydroxythreonine-4-phosphate dehydrogenase 1 [Methyloceanibacter sp.]|nr:MAG: 4-hydroxythreonine-4-phosphate dehydrogenase 1 [Methyloceanibacter sp.]